MVETISPVVHGGRAGRWATAVAVHALGATLAAATAGLVLGTVGLASGAPWGRAGAMAVAGVAIAYAARDLFRMQSPPLVEARRQVPEWWRTFFSPRAASFLYGLGLGVGFLTYLGHGTLLAVAVAALAIGDPWVGAAVMAPFGLARALAPLAAMGARTAAEAAAAADRLDALGRSRGRTVGNAVALLGVAAAAGVAAASRDVAPADATRFAPLALAGLFAWAALAKAIRPASWRRSLAAHQLPGWTGRVAVAGVPLAEASVAALLATGLHRPGAVGALALLGGFSVALVRTARRRGGDVPCGCFGSQRPVDVRLGLLRNAGLAALAVLAFGAPGPVAVWSRPPWTGDALPIVLVAVGLVAGAWFVVRAASAMRPGASR